MNTELPIASFYDKIVEAVLANPVIIITAETGAGKSTQVPQFLLDHGFNVVVTEPRRLATYTVAERVASEYGTELGAVVGYRMAGDFMESHRTKCLFCTDGLALVRELIGKNKTDILVIDEIHEWNMNIEVLVAWVREEIKKGRKLKVVLMSATMESEKLSKYFHNAPIIRVPGRTFEVEEIPARHRTHAEQAAEFVRQGKNVLVFEAGTQEIMDTIRELKDLRVGAEVLPLHGELTSDEQRRCFNRYVRHKVVVATNVAQTSVTIDDIDAVVDSGMERRIETSNGVEGLFLRPISESDRTQRKGRAGRTRPGVYVDFCPHHERPQYPKAEILRHPLDQVVLRLAEAGFDAEELEFFHQPDSKEIHGAKKVLLALGCLTLDGKVTDIGHKVSCLPVGVRAGRMIVEAQKFGVVNEVITIASIFEAGEIHMRKTDYGSPNHDWRQLVEENTSSDLLAQLQLYKHANLMKKEEMKARGINAKSYYRVVETRKQILSSIRGKIEMSEGSDVEAIRRSIVSGMVDHLFQKNPYVSLYRNGDDVQRTIARGSIFAYNEPEWLVGLPWDFEIKKRYGKEMIHTVTLATKVTIKEMMEIAPHLVTRKMTGVASYNPASKRYEDTEEVFIGQIMVSQGIIQVEEPKLKREDLTGLVDFFGKHHSSAKNR